MSSSATMQQANIDATPTAQRSSRLSSQLAVQHQQNNASAIQSELTDLRPQTTAQRQLQDAANNSPQSRQLQAFQQMAQNSAGTTQLKTMSAMMNAPVVQRVEEDDEPLQAKSAGETVQREATETPKPNNTGLPDNLKSGIESLSGMSMDHVKVHYNSSQPAQLNAHAYAQGSEIHVAPGQEQHLPHEAWHVVQQVQGRVQPTMQMKAGVPVNDDAGLEAEADVMGAAAKDMGRHKSSELSSNIQRKVGLNEGKNLAIPSDNTMDVAQRYKNTAYKPNLVGLDVPNSKLDTEAYDSDAFERPKDWYENTFESLFKAAPKALQINPFDGSKYWVVQCGVTGQACTPDALDIGHKTNWKIFVNNTKPETMREAVNAYNDLSNLRLESASANRSHDFELSSTGKFKDLPGIDDFGSGKKAKAERDKFIEKKYGDQDMDTYDENDDFIDNSEYEQQTFVTREKIWLADEGGLNSGVGAWFGETTVILSTNVRGRYMEVTILTTNDPQLNFHVGKKFWGNLRNLKKGEIVTY